MEDKTIYNLKLHEQYKLNDNINILRVPGGWIYMPYNMYENNVFVPFHNEFLQFNFNDEIVRK